MESTPHLCPLPIIYLTEPVNCAMICHHTRAKLSISLNFDIEYSLDSLQIFKYLLNSPYLYLIATY